MRPRPSATVLEALGSHVALRHARSGRATRPDIDAPGQVGLDCDAAGDCYGGYAVRRWTLLVVLAVGLIALVGVAAFVAWPRPDRVTRENFDRIKVGMSRTEVEAILGPQGDYTTGPTNDSIARSHNNLAPEL